MNKLLRLLLAGLDVSATFICLIALAGLVVPSALIGIFEALKQVANEASSALNHHPEVAWAVIASVAWCALRWKKINKPGPSERIFESPWPKRIGLSTAAGAFGIAMAACFVALIIHWARYDFRTFDIEGAAALLMCAFMSWAALAYAYRALRGEED